MPPRSGKKKAAPKKTKARLAAEKAAQEAEEAAQQAAAAATTTSEEDQDVEMKEEDNVQPEASTSKSATAANDDASPSTVAAVVEEVKAEVGAVVEKAKETVVEVAAAVEEFVDEMTGVESASGPTADSQSPKPDKGKGKAKVVETVEDVAAAAGEFVNKMTCVEDSSGSSSKDQSRSESTEAEDAGAAAGSGSKTPVTLEERRSKMEQLRKKMAAGTRANRESLAEEAAKAKLNARELARLDRQRKLAETLRLKADAEERGEDAERQKNWEYTLEENDEWEKKLARKKRRADFEFHDDAHAARRRYKKDLDQIKPDLEAYNKQKAIAMGLNPSGSGSSALTAFSSTSSAVSTVTAEQQRIAHDNLYRDANTLIYGDNKPTDEAIDRVVGKVNKDIEKKNKFHRKRVNEAEGDITYINEHNRVFNNKIKRYYDKYTTEIRDSFERGTAL